MAYRGDPFGYNQFGTMMMFSDGVIHYQIVRQFKPEDWQKEIFAASTLLDATRDKSGKLILLHGTADQVVAIGGTTDY